MVGQWHIVWLVSVIFLLKDQGMIERSSEGMGAAMVCNNFSPIPSKISFHMKKKKDSSLPISVKLHTLYKVLKSF